MTSKNINLTIEKPLQTDTTTSLHIQLDNQGPGTEDELSVNTPFGDDPTATPIIGSQNGNINNMKYKTMIAGQNEINNALTNLKNSINNEDRLYESRDIDENMNDELSFEFEDGRLVHKMELPNGYQWYPAINL